MGGICLRMNIRVFGSLGAKRSVLANVSGSFRLGIMAVTKR